MGGTPLQCSPPEEAIEAREGFVWLGRVVWAKGVGPVTLAQPGRETNTMYGRAIPRFREIPPLVLLGLAALLIIPSCHEGEPVKPAAPASELLIPELPAAIVSGDFEHPRSPDRFRVRVEVADLGSFVIEVTRAWAPRAADRFHDLVGRGFFDQAPFFRAVPDFVVQFGRAAWPEANAAWLTRSLLDETEAQAQPNRVGTVAFAKGQQANSRTTEIFINLRDNSRPLDGEHSLDTEGFLPFGRVVEGMDIVKAIYTGYGEMSVMRSDGGGVDAGRLAREGIGYIFDAFPMMDRIEQAQVLD